MDKKTIIIILTILLLSGLIYLLYDLFGVDIQIKLNYDVIYLLQILKYMIVMMR